VLLDADGQWLDNELLLTGATMYGLFLLFLLFLCGIWFAHATEPLTPEVLMWRAYRARVRWAHITFLWRVLWISAVIFIPPVVGAAWLMRQPPH
jgi:hypothetical protein